jgi:hypothetical protein
MSDINVIIEQIDDTVIVEVNPINDEVNVIIGSVVNQVGGIEEAPNDGKQYARKDLGWSEVVGSLPANVAFTDEENFFEETQEINKIITDPTTENHTELSGSATEYYVAIKNSIGAVLAGFWFSGGSNKGLSPLADDALDLGKSTVQFRWKELFLSSYANVLGVKSVTNDSKKAFFSNGSEAIAFKQDTVGTTSEASAIWVGTQSEYDLLVSPETSDSIFNIIEP